MKISYNKLKKKKCIHTYQTYQFMRMPHHTNTDGLPPSSVILAISLPFPLCSPSSCHVCDFQTELNAQFVSHMSLHVDKEQWMFSLCCSVCDYACMEETDMKNHISTGHAGTESPRRSPDCASPSYVDGMCVWTSNDQCFSVFIMSSGLICLSLT